MTGTKERILNKSTELFRRQGYAGTGLKQIVAEANAPFGSIYHFFPGGKEQLGAEVIRSSGKLFLLMGAEILGRAPDIVSGVRAFFAGAAETLVETDYADACPIATVALEVSSTNELLRTAAADVFESWIAGCEQLFSAAGIPSAKARELALTMLSLLEGAFVFSRAMRSTEAITIAGASAVVAVRAALPESPRVRGRRKAEC
jgi:AcrR family transcriptional regulator